MDTAIYVDAIEFAKASIGRNLKRIREEAGLTQAEVAHLARMHPETISRLESGQGNPTVSTVTKIVQAIRSSR